MCVDDHIHGLDLTNTSHLPTGPSTHQYVKQMGQSLKTAMTWRILVQFHGKLWKAYHI